MRRQHEYLDTEHLVLGLAHQDDAASPLLALGIDRQQVYTVVDGTIRRGDSPIVADRARPFTSRTKAAFSLANTLRYALSLRRLVILSSIGVPVHSCGAVRAAARRVLASGNLTCQP